MYWSAIESAYVVIDAMIRLFLYISKANIAGQRTSPVLILEGAIIEISFTTLKSIEKGQCFFYFKTEGEFQ